jgi:tRNA(adenine34) deaminase
MIEIEGIKSYMQVCEQLGRSAADKGNSPVGCVILIDDQIIAYAEEASKSAEDVTCHAEIEAIRKARLRYGTDLSMCTLISTHEPCVMCGYAIRFHKIRRVIYKNEVEHFGSITSAMPVLRTSDVPNRWNEGPEIIRFDT